MTAESAFVKTPDALLDYGFDWSPWLIDGDVIIASTWVVDAGLDEGGGSNGDSIHADGFDDTTTKIWLGGGEHDVDYQAENFIETQDGRRDSRTLTIKVRNRR